MKLSEWARRNGVHYQTAYRWFRSGALPVPARKLPRPAKANWWSYVVLITMVVYFGFFFANFLVNQLTGNDLSFW